MEVVESGPVASTVTITSPEQVRVGKKAQVEIEVTSSADATPTGDVVLSVDGRELPAVTLEDGKAIFTIGPLGKPRTVQLVASYAGDDAVQPGTATARIEVVTPKSAG